MSGASSQAGPVPGLERLCQWHHPHPAKAIGKHHVEEPPFVTLSLGLSYLKFGEATCRPAKAHLRLAHPLFALLATTPSFTQSARVEALLQVTIRIKIHILLP